MAKCYYCGKEAEHEYYFEDEGKQLRAGLCDECIKKQGFEEEKEAEIESEEIDNEILPPSNVEGEGAWKIISIICFIISAVFLISSNQKTKDVIDVLEAANDQSVAIIFAVLGGIFSIVYYCSKIANEIKEARCNLYDYIGKRK